MENSEQAHALEFSPEHHGKDADADATRWEGVAPATAASYANAGGTYEEEGEVGKTVVSVHMYGIVLLRFSCPVYVRFYDSSTGVAAFW